MSAYFGKDPIQMLASQFVTFPSDVVRTGIEQTITATKTFTAAPQLSGISWPQLSNDNSLVTNAFVKGTLSSALSSQTYDFSQMSGVYNALKDVVSFLGATVTGWPLPS